MSVSVENYKGFTIVSADDGQGKPIVFIGREEEGVLCDCFCDGEWTISFGGKYPESGLDKNMVLHGRHISVDEIKKWIDNDLSDPTFVSAENYKGFTIVSARDGHGKPMVFVGREGENVTCKRCHNEKWFVLFGEQFLESKLDKNLILFGGRISMDEMKRWVDHRR